MSERPSPSLLDADAARALSRQQFGPVAAAYADSPSHAGGPSLARMRELAPPRPTDRAPDVAEVIASDITPEMLEQVRRLAASRGLCNVKTRGDAPAEALPFDDSEF